MMQSIPCVEKPPAAAAFLYERATFLATKQANFYENEIWLDEVLAEAINSFSKPENLTLLPKTPSMKNKRKARITKGSKGSRGPSLKSATSSPEGITPPEDEANAKRSKLAFVLEEDTGVEEDIQVIKDILGEPIDRETKDRSDGRSTRSGGAIGTLELPLRTKRTVEPKKNSKDIIPMPSLEEDENSVDRTESSSEIFNDVESSAVKETIQKFQQLTAASSVSEEDISVSKLKNVKLETKRMLSDLSAEFASPERVTRKTFVSTTSPKPQQPRVGESGDGDKNDDDEDDVVELNEDNPNDGHEIEKIEESKPPIEKAPRTSLVPRKSRSHRLSLRNQARHSLLVRRSSTANRSIRRSSIRKSTAKRNQRSSLFKASLASLAQIPAEEFQSLLQQSVPNSNGEIPEGGREFGTVDAESSSVAEKIEDEERIEKDDAEEEKDMVEEEEEEGRDDEGKMMEDEDEDGKEDERLNEKEEKEEEEDLDDQDALEEEEENEEEEEESPPPVRMTRTKARKKEEKIEEEEEEEEEAPPQRCTRSKFRAVAGKEKTGEISGARTQMSTLSLKTPAVPTRRLSPRLTAKASPTQSSRPMHTPIHSASASKAIRTIQMKLLSSASKTAAPNKRTVPLAANTPSFGRYPSKLTTPSSAQSTSKMFSVGTGGKFASGISSFLPKKVTPNRLISPTEEFVLKQARLKEKEQKEEERKLRLKEKKEAESEELRRKNKERQERAEFARQERLKQDEANRQRMAKTKNALASLANKKKEEKDKEEREKKKEQLRKNELAELKRKEEEERKAARQQQLLEDENKRAVENKRRLEEQEKERQRKLSEQKRQEEAQRLEKLAEEKSSRERMRRLAEEKERERQRLVDQRKKEMERERVERQRQEMERLRLKQAEQERAVAEAREAAKKKAEEEAVKSRAEVAKPPVPFIPSTVSKAPVLNSTYVADTSVAEEDCSSYEMTPQRLPEPSTATNYVIDDLSSGDDTDDDEHPRKKIPSWAEKSNLRNILLRNDYYRPNLADLFGIVEAPDLSRIFTKTVKKRYFKRGSSGIWDGPILPPGDYSQK